MEITVLAFGIIREIFSEKRVLMELPENSTAQDLRNKLTMQFPRMGALASCLIAVNDEYAEDDQILHAEDEIAIIPPVSGG